MKASDQVFAALRDAIVGGELATGSRHSIYELADRFGVSRTPVREAVLRLADTGMVTVEKNRGVRIRGLSVVEIAEIFELRLLLEVPAARFAAAQADAALLDALVERLEARIAGMQAAIAADDVSAFLEHDRGLHDDILAGYANERMRRTVSALRDATQAMGASTMNRTRGLQEVEVEHLPVVAAIRARNAEAAASAMREHLERTARLLMRQMADVSGEPVPAAWPAPGRF
jgi:DNA-binding GntR family transcriptional regulator